MGAYPGQCLQLQTHRISASRMRTRLWNVLLGRGELGNVFRGLEWKECCYRPCTCFLAIALTSDRNVYRVSKSASACSAIDTCSAAVACNYMMSPLRGCERNRRRRRHPQLGGADLLTVSSRAVILAFAGASQELL